IVMSLVLIFTGTDYCSMKQHEDNARAGDLFTTADRPYGDDVDTKDDAHGHVIDLVALTHEMGFAREVSNRVIFIDEGRIQEDEPPQELFSNPKHPR
ncbi:hypothetical protein P0G09_20045, partial [Faecalibacterium sp. DFI.5.82]|nr:hypothetical protein [Faecalibacterium sp. DFI.5.82]